MHNIFFENKVSFPWFTEKRRVSHVVNSRPNQSEITMTTKRHRISHPWLWRHLPIDANESQELCLPRRSLAENTGSAFWFALRLLPFAQPLKWSWPTVKKKGKRSVHKATSVEIQSTESSYWKDFWTDTIYANVISSDLSNSVEILFS